MSTQHRTFFGKIFGAIGDIFHKSSQKLWESLSPEEQAAIKAGSGIINIINIHIAETPEIIKEALIAEFPNLPDLESKLLALCTAANITPPTLDLTGAITAIQTFLQSKEGGVWEWASSALAQGLSLIFAPQTTLFAKIVSLVEFVYNSFIKKK